MSGRVHEGRLRRPDDIHGALRHAVMAFSAGSDARSFHRLVSVSPSRLQLRKIPESTALIPAVRFTVMATVPPEATLTGKLIQAPWLKSVTMVTV